MSPIAPEIDVDRLLRFGGLSQVEHHATLGSTNDRARELAPALAGTDTALVIADQQTAGRGRGSNRWWTGTGSLAFSLVIDSAARGIRRSDSPLIALAAALAIVEAVEPLVAPCPIGLHWPNDVFAGGRKLSGILVEALVDGRHVVGIGLNVNNDPAAAPPEVRARATSIVELAGCAHDRNDVLLGVLARLWPNLDELAGQASHLARRADRRCLQRDAVLKIDTGARQAQGRCLGIADDGALVLETRDRRERFYSGVLIHG